MKNLFLLAFLFFIQNSLAVAPYGIKGQAQSQTLYSNVHQFPNQNVTNIGGINALVYDSGLIFDGGFESATAFQGHTIVSGSAYFAVVTTASDVLDGKKTARVTCFNAAPSGVCKIEQTVNLGTPRLRGFPMLLSVRVDSSPDQPLTFCAKIDGVEKDCVTGYKGYLTIPTLAGVTSVGYTLSKNEYVSPLTSFFDSIKVEITETVTNAPVVGPRVAYTPTFQGLGTPTTVSCEYNQDGPNLVLDCSFTPTADTSSASRIFLPQGLTIKGNWTGATIAGSFSFNASGGNKGGFVLMSPNDSFISLANRDTIGGSSVNPLAIPTSGTSTSCPPGVLCSVKAIVPIAQYAASVPTYSDRCRDPLKCEWDFSAHIPTTGTSSNHNIQGWISGNCTGTTTKTCPINPALGLTLPLVCTGTVTIDSTYVAGFPVASQTTSNIVMTTRDAGVNVAANQPVNIKCSMQYADYINAKVNQIVGSFKDYVKTPNTATGKVGFCSAKISATGVISDQLGGCFASCTNATTPVCTFTSNYWRSGSVPNCWATSNDGTVLPGYVTSLSTTTFSHTMLNGALNPQAGARTYACHGEIQ